MYVSQQDRTHFEYTVERINADTGKGPYTAADTKVLSVIKTGVPNYNDDVNGFEVAVEDLSNIFSFKCTKDRML
ncbi:hypothetical protein [Pricia antarctica]|uniref:hypothetical protein n=1 Tax=Pricia antarctica TaxID=641691 RepID=UPI000B82FDA0|nr:hypothetical protein [Pricia antarctica]